MEQSEFNITTIQNFLEAYSPADVKAAVSNWAKVRVSGRLKIQEMARTQAGWTKHDGTYWNIPKGYDWQRHGQDIWIKPSQPVELPEGECKDKEAILARAAAQAAQPKQDLTPVVSDLKCPICGEGTVREPICKGCREGAVGFTFRHICMEEDTHIFYVKAVEDVVEV
jgi:hypothetical protein